MYKRQHFAQQAPRGEITIVVAGATPGSAEPDLSAALEEVRSLIGAGLPHSNAVSHVARRRGVPRGELYRASLKGKDEGA